jgi:hypothetical protein
MVQCFYMIAFPEKRCPNEGRWISPNVMPPVDKFVWCDDHKHEDDVLAPPNLQGANG